MKCQKNRDRLWRSIPKFDGQLGRYMPSSTLLLKSSMPKWLEWWVFTCLIDQLECVCTRKSMSAGVNIYISFAASLGSFVCVCVRQREREREREGERERAIITSRDNAIMKQHLYTTLSEGIQTWTDDDAIDTLPLDQTSSSSLTRSLFQSSLTIYLNAASTFT